MASLFSDNEDDYRIVVTDAERTRLNDQWQAQMGRAPTDQELRGLIEQWIREEIYYREALRMGLDANDTIIRRRLAQKLTFLTEDVASASAPSKETLQAYFADNAERYTIPEQTSFRHRYFSVERREDARADAVAALADESNGDPFILQLAFDLHSERQIADLFGSDFASTMRRLDGSGWQGPLQSAYGWHLVSIEQRTPARVPGFDEVARNVAIDHKQELRRQANERYFETLRNRYEISGS